MAENGEGGEGPLWMSEETSKEVTFKLDLSIVKELDQEEWSRYENNKHKCSEARSGVACSRNRRRSVCLGYSGPRRRTGEAEGVSGGPVMAGPLVCGREYRCNSKYKSKLLWSFNLEVYIVYLRV